MNKQLKTRGGQVVGRGIEWCDYTWNVVRGCQHRCRWRMPDGKIAICYAETTAQGVARESYKLGFEHHYFQPDRIDDPLKLAAPARIFMDSMSDLMGAWVPESEIEQVLDVARKAPQHTYQLLTKNAPRLLQFRDLPPNVWPGVSVPPDFFLGHELTQTQKFKMLVKALEVLWELNAHRPDLVTWMSIEPLSWDIADILDRMPGALRWIVIGAASNGRLHYQPNAEHVRKLLVVADAQQIPVFLKGNLDWHPHREEFPTARVAA